MAISLDTDQEQACVFLGTQSGAIERALRDPLDERALDEALRAHDESHDGWVRLLAAMERQGDHALQAEVTALYEFHGRLAESLERGLDGWFHIEAAQEIRTVLADRLVCSTGNVLVTLVTSAPAVRPARRTARTAQPVPL